MLDNYLHKQAKQDIKKKISACFILSDDDIKIKGYYTLSNTSINKDELPARVIKKLPTSYTNLPATLLGRLAVDSSFKGQGIGTMLLMDALKRSYDNLTTMTSMSVIVDPLDDEAVAFYDHFGFILLPDSGKMFITMTQLEAIFSTTK
jgi:GNAT superfamily N-acetyltransferase